MRLAILSTPPARIPALLNACVSDPRFADPAGAADLLHNLGRFLGGSADESATPATVLANSDKLPLEFEFAVWSGWVDGLSKNRTRAKTFDWAALRSGDAWRSLRDRARAALDDEAAPLTLRVQAVALLQQEPPDAVENFLAERLSPRQPRELQLAIARAIGASGTPAAAELLVASSRGLSPAVRAEVVDMLASRPAWHEALFAAIDAGTIRASDVPVPRRNLLLKATDARIKEKAEALFGASAVSTRQAALDASTPALELASDARRGFETFRRECAQCHRSRDTGFEVGPPLGSVKNRSPQELLVHILDPNREVGPNFVDHVAVLKDGRTLTGLLLSETETQVVLVRAQGLRDEIPRQEIDELVSSGKSLMPEGLEQKLPPQDLADLIDYLRHPEAIDDKASP
jgi:putative heme-binding domain-containing protein